ncbi:MAG: GNAT family N-acetyltransferase [Microbacterium sp.]|uniref:GNAT family N-acetyltransferase n=1 Tax=Microbacterium sp. TaxID=51671 RepID=UPI003F9B0940
MTTPAVSDLPQIIMELSGWQNDHGNIHLHPGDLGWHSLAGSATTAANLRVWSRDGKMIALGLLDEPDVLRMAMVPTVFDDEELARQITSDVSIPDSGVLDAGEAVIEARGARSLQRTLSEEGWIADELWTPFQQDLSRSIDKGQTDRTGLRVETVVGGGQAEEWLSVHWSAFRGTIFGDDDKRRRLQQWENMTLGAFADLSRSLIAFDPDDNAVAVTTVWSAGKDRPGLIEPMGVHRDHRGRGYGVAITVAAAGALKEMGSTSAVVAAETSNGGACATYEAAGFTPHKPVADLKRTA